MRHLISLAILVGLTAPVALTQDATAPAAPPTAATAPAATGSAAPRQSGTIHGAVFSGTTAASGVPLPGVAVTAKDEASGKTYTTTTDVNGAYSMKVPVGAKYAVSTDLAGFSEGSAEITLSGADQLADFGVQLASRAEQQQAAQTAAKDAAATRTAAAQTPSLAAEAARATQAPQTAAAARPGGRPGAGRQVVRQTNRQATGNRPGTTGAQTTVLDVTSTGDELAPAATDGAAASSDNAGNAGGIDSSVSSDSVAVSGQEGQTNGLANYSQADIEQRMAAMQNGGGGFGGPGGGDNAAIAGMLGGLMGGGGPGGPGGGPGGGGGGGRGGGGGGRGGGGGGGRGGGGFGGGGFRQFNQNQIHGNVGYTGSNSVLNAQQWLPPSSAPRTATPYSRNNLTVSATGIPYIPRLTKPNPKQSLSLSLGITHNTTPSLFLGTVPTVAERAGDFSGLTQNVNGTATPVQLYDPKTGTAIAANNLHNAATPISPQALSLLNYYPAPNIGLTSQGYNYQTSTTNAVHTENGSLRFTRNFGQAAAGGRRGGAPGGARGAGGRQPNQNAPRVLTQNISFNGSYSHSASDNHSIFLPLGGNSDTTGYNFAFSHSLGYGRIRNSFTVSFNRSNSTASNYFTNGSVNPATQAGISIGDAAGLIQGNAFNYGVPGLSFGSAGFTGLGDAQPSQGIGQTISLSDFVSWRKGKHNFRFGADLRRVHSDSTGGGNVLGSFTFTGYATQNPAAGECTAGSTGCVPSGNSFADFLFGLPQTSSIQASQFKTYLRQTVYDWYVQDDWRLGANLSVTWGLRYEYFAPLTEKNNHLTNLDHSADFKQIAVVLPGQTGSVSGIQYPTSLVKPDRMLYSPRVGIAYKLPAKLSKNTLLRAGYGINYTTNQYQRFASKLTFQPPYAITQTNNATTPTVAGTKGCVGQSASTNANLTLAHGFNCSTASVQNNYAVNPNYRLGYVQVYNLGIQKTLPLGLVLNIGYNGAMGGDQDMLRYPNRTALSILNPDAQVFTYEDSLGYSRFNALAVTLNKRLQRGISLGGTYTYGHSIDNASALGGGGGGSVAQNDADLNAEEANSSFDTRHRISGNFLIELPFGPGRLFLTKGGFVSKVLDGWGLSGNYTFATGGYQTPVYNLTVSEAATGANGLRPDRVFSQPIAGPKTLTQWFNTSAFTAPANIFGTASRNSIQRPGTESVNAVLSRIIQLGDTRSLMFQFQANNALNIVQYSGIDTTRNDPKFGQVTSAAAMRSITYTARYRF